MGFLEGYGYLYYFVLIKVCSFFLCWEIVVGWRIYVVEIDGNYLIGYFEGWLVLFKDYFFIY